MSQTVPPDAQSDVLTFDTDLYSADDFSIFPGSKASSSLDEGQSELHHLSGKVTSPINLYTTSLSQNSGDVRSNRAVCFRCNGFENMAPDALRLNTGTLLCLPTLSHNDLAAAAHLTAGHALS